MPNAGVATWMQLLPTSSPPARSYLAMTYDAASGKIVMFGGYDGTEDPFTPGRFEFELSRRPSVLIFSNQGNDEVQRNQYVGVFLAGLMQANSPARADLRNSQSTGTGALLVAIFGIDAYRQGICHRQSSEQLRERDRNVAVADDWLNLPEICINRDNYAEPFFTSTRFGSAKCWKSSFSHYAKSAKSE